MATTRNFTSTYAGEALPEYLTELFAGGETLSAGIRIVPNVKYKKVLKKYYSDSIVHAYNCDFTASGTTNIVERSLVVKPFEVTLEFCFDDAWDLWDAADMAAGMNNEELPANFIDAVVIDTQGQVGQEIDDIIWQGSGATTSLDVRGLMAILSEDSAVRATGVTTGTTGITSSNIGSILQDMENNMPKGLLAAPKNKVKFFVSYKAATAYKQYQFATFGGVITSLGDKQLDYNGWEIVPVYGIDDDFMAVGELSNFAFGTDLESDFNELRSVDMRETTMDDKVRFRLKGKIDVNVGYPAEIVYFDGR